MLVATQMLSVRPLPKFLKFPGSKLYSICWAKRRVHAKFQVIWQPFRCATKPMKPGTVEIRFQAKSLNFSRPVAHLSGFFLTSALKKIKTQGQNSSKKLKEKTQLWEDFPSHVQNSRKKLKFIKKIPQIFMPFLWQISSKTEKLNGSEDLSSPTLPCGVKKRACFNPSFLKLFLSSILIRIAPIVSKRRTVYRICHFVGSIVFDPS